MTNNNDYYKDENVGNNERASIGNDSSSNRDFNSIDLNKNFNHNNNNGNDINNNSNQTTTTTTTSTLSPNYNNNNNNNNNNSAPNNDDLEFANQLKNVQKQINSNTGGSNNNTGFVLNNVDTILSNMPKNSNNNNNNKFNDDQFNQFTPTNSNKSIHFNFNNNSNNSNTNNNSNTYSINDNDIDNQNDFGEDYDLPNNSSTSQDFTTYSSLRKNANIIKVCAFLLMSFSIISYFTQAWWLIFSFGIFACPLGIYSAHNLLKYHFTIFIGYLLVDMVFRIIYLFTHLSYLKGFGIFLSLLSLALEGYFTYFSRQFQQVMPINGRITYKEFYTAMGSNGIFDC